MKSHTVTVDSITIDNHKPFTLIAGPCSIESETLALRVATEVKKITRRLGIPYVFKSSYDKANRSSIRSFRGPGLEQGLKILSTIKSRVGVPILTDVHSPEEAYESALVADIIQIPAFLARQTDLLLAAGRTGRAVNIKKAQFMAPWDMKNAIEKVESTGNRKILVTERGTLFGYNNLVVDMRGLEIMKSYGFPVIYDATHSVQLPGAKGASSGGQRQFVYPLAKAAVAVGVSALFMEIHPNPDSALSDGPNSVRLRDLEAFLRTFQKLDEVTKAAAKAHKASKNFIDVFHKEGNP